MHTELSLRDVVGQHGPRRSHRRLTPVRLLLKRALDIIGALIAIVLLSPVMIGVGIAVRVRLGGPIVFSQSRTGRHGAPFTMIKFRTMSTAVDSEGEPLPDDQRLTAFGRALRRTSLDELPELFNVLIGDMSLVGPRPLLEEYTAYFSDAEANRLLVRPGITGLAQVSGRNTVGWDDRLALDVEYVENLSIRTDIRLVLATAQAVLRRDGVVEDPSSAMEDFDVERARRL